MSTKWEIIDDDVASVRRIRVAGGWLYQVETTMEHSHAEDGERSYGESRFWGPPVFVSCPVKEG